MGFILDDIFGTDMAGQGNTDAALAAQMASVREANQTLGTQYNQGNRALQDAYTQQQGYLSPYQSAGNNALSSLASGNFASNLEMDPGYQFRLKEGQKALEGSAAARGGLNSGATMKALTRYGQDFASNEYAKSYDRNYDRLSQLAGFGQNAANNLSQAAGNYGGALNSNLTGYGQSVSDNLIGRGNAQAAAQIGQANRNSSMFGDIIGGGSAIGAGYLMSDIRTKTDIKEISKESLKEMKRTITPYLFKYIDDKNGKGDWVGVMAQDLEKSPLGRTLVVQGDDGIKRIDLKRAISMLLATMAEA